MVYFWQLQLASVKQTQETLQTQSFIRALVIFQWLSKHLVCRLVYNFRACVHDHHVRENEAGMLLVQYLRAYSAVPKRPGRELANGMAGVGF